MIVSNRVVGSGLLSIPFKWRRKHQQLNINPQTAPRQGAPCLVFQSGFQPVLSCLTELHSSKWATQEPINNFNLLLFAWRKVSHHVTLKRELSQANPLNQVNMNMEVNIASVSLSLLCEDSIRFALSILTTFPFAVKFRMSWMWWQHLTLVSRFNIEFVFFQPTTAGGVTEQVQINTLTNGMIKE